MWNNKKGSLWICFLTFLITVNGQQKKPDAYQYDIHKHVICNNGVVVSAHTLASEAGLSMLQHGGNAVDAAIATQLALAVVYPGAGNIGGGGFMVAHLKSAAAPDGKNITIDYRE